MDEHIDVPLNVFRGFIVNLYPCKTVKPDASTQHRQSNSARDYVVPIMKYKFCGTGRPPHRLKPEKGVPVMVPGSVLHPATREWWDVRGNGSHGKCGTIWFCGQQLKRNCHICTTSHQVSVSMQWCPSHTHSALTLSCICWNSAQMARTVIEEGGSVS